ncbi:MAG: HAMP domain-containing histidine kinase [Chitinophagaceae bacterium]|nr:HAMP domain-containing histidine kinase [Chitinophagaceae bacterium]
MFFSKSPTPRQLAAITAFLLSLPAPVIIYHYENKWIWAIVSFVLFFSSAYFLILFVLEHFIYRKIKLIYKFIHKTKATKKEEIYYRYVLPLKSIDEVRQDVENWAAENEKELELLRQNEQFRREFLQNLSHEFKTPVFAIQGYIDTLLNGAMEEPVINKKFLEKTAKNVKRLTHLLNDLDEISRLERGELQLHKENFVIQDLVKEVFENFSTEAEAMHISCGIKKGCEMPLIVFADKEKIRQVLNNLIENSIKYGKYGGNITASMYKMDGKRILVEITDDGIGIREKDIPRIFERFYRTESGRNVNVSGSGLGLAICKHIIEAHGQTVHVRSKEGIGTTVGFTLEVKS